MASVLIQDTRRSELLLDSSTDDSHDVTLVCSDGSLKFGSHRLLGMWSPALRSGADVGDLAGLPQVDGDGGA